MGCSAYVAHELRILQIMQGTLQGVQARSPLVGELLAPVDGVVEAYVYGSWAARYAGEPGRRRATSTYWWSVLPTTSSPTRPAPLSGASAGR